MKRNRSWFTLVLFCASIALATALALGALFASATLAFAVARTLKPFEAQSASESGSAAGPADSSEGTTFVGLVTDTHCGAKHQDQGKNPSECAKTCVRNGAKYSLVNGDKTYTLEGDNAQLDKLSGQRVSVAGMLDGNSIKVTSISAGQ